jgi:beta-fructofuranosidase
VHWDVLPPVTPAGEFAQVECPQLVDVDGKSLILFSCLEEDHSPARLRRLGRSGETGTYVFAAAELWGHYIPSPDPIVSASTAHGPLYAGKAVVDPAKRWSFIGFRGAGNRDFVGELTDPLPLSIDTEGGLRVIDHQSLATVGANVARR